MEFFSMLWLSLFSLMKEESQRRLFEKNIKTKIAIVRMRQLILTAVIYIFIRTIVDHQRN